MPELVFHYLCVCHRCIFASRLLLVTPGTDSFVYDTLKFIVHYSRAPPSSVCGSTSDRLGKSLLRFITKSLYRLWTQGSRGDASSGTRLTLNPSYFILATIDYPRTRRVGVPCGVFDFQCVY